MSGDRSKMRVDHDPDVRIEAQQVDPRDWSTLAPILTALANEPLTPAMVPDWLARWSALEKVVREARAALKRERSRDLTNEAQSHAFRQFADQIFAPFNAATRTLATKLLALSDYHPDPDEEEFVRRWRADADRASTGSGADEAAIGALTDEYARIVARMVTVIDGREIPGPEYWQLLDSPDRPRREAAWRARSEAWRAVRPRINDLTLELIARRRSLARQSGFPDYRAYCWREIGRLDYTPADCLALHAAVAESIVPLAARRHEARRQRLGITTLRPWDISIDPAHGTQDKYLPTLSIFEEAMAGVFTRLNPEVGALFERMRHGFLDLGWRPGKQTGGEEWFFPLSAMPYLVVGADGDDSGVNLLLHEMGHAYHDSLAVGANDLIWKLEYPSEFAEFAAITMTHFARPYLARERGGFLGAQQAAHDRAAYFDSLVIGGIGDEGIPNLSLDDAFQHWAYAEAPTKLRAADLDAKWRELTSRFTPWVDWRGLEEEAGTGWQRSWGLFDGRFYSINYAIAHLGALQMLGRLNADPAAAWRDYRAALALGGTRDLPTLFHTAGTQLPFDSAIVHEAARIAEAQVS